MLAEPRRDEETKRRVARVRSQAGRGRGVRFTIGVLVAGLGVAALVAENQTGEDTTSIRDTEPHAGSQMA